MKKFFISAAIAAALGAGSFAGFRALNPAERQLSDIELDNIEALAEDEMITIPCMSALKSCKFMAKNSLGQIGEVTMINMVKTGLSL